MVSTLARESGSCREGLRFFLKVHFDTLYACGLRDKLCTGDFFRKEDIKVRQKLTSDRKNINTNILRQKDNLAFTVLCASRHT